MKNTPLGLLENYCLPPLTGWREDAACRDMPPEIFFPRRNTRAELKSVCAGCSVRAECLDEALEWGYSGWWGGTSATTRRKISDGVLSIGDAVRIGGMSEDERRAEVQRLLSDHNAKLKRRAAKRAESASYVRWRDRLRERLAGDPDDRAHGTRSGYSNGKCRCDRCVDAYRDWMRRHSD